MSIISIGIPIPDRSALPGQTGSGEEVNLQYATQNYCANSSNPSPTVATPAGGAFSYAPGGISGGANGTIVIANSQPGNYIVTYTVAGVGSANFPINISALDDASFSYSASAFCADASNQTPIVTTPGGTFTTQDITFRPFQMQFEVSSGVSKTITIPNTVGSSYTVNWGDGTTTTESAGNISHTYDGSYPNPTVSIGASSDTGPFTTFSFANTGSKSDLLDVPQWGSIVFSTFINMFSGCNNANFQISATDAPTISSTGNPVMSYMFSSPSTFNSDISHWDVSNIDGGIAYYSFQAWLQNNSSFNQNLSSWDIQTTSCLQFWSRAFGMSTENFTDTIVGWAVKVYKNSGLYDVDMSTANGVTFDCSRTSDNASGQTYAAKYGSDWPSNPAGENWTNAGDAFDYLTGTTANWSITQFASQNC